MLNSQQQELSLAIVEKEKEIKHITQELDDLRQTHKVNTEQQLSDLQDNLVYRFEEEKQKMCKEYSSRIDFLENQV